MTACRSCLLAAVAAAIWGLGCGPHAPDNPTEFLKWSMSKYGSMRSFETNCTVGMNSDGNEMHSSRTLVYEKPNKWRIECQLGQSLQVVSVCDGMSSATYATAPGSPVKKGPAPASISLADKGFDQPVVVFGSLLYKFLAGRSTLGEVADTARKPISFGADANVDGTDCKTVKFYAIGAYGNTEIAIGASDGLVRRITCDLAGFRLAAGHKVTATETYSGNKVNGTVAADRFVATPTPGPGDEFIGKPAPDITVVALDGNKTVKLSDMRGKVVLLDFWATWCMPCVRAMPENQKLFDRYRNKGLTVMAVSREDEQTIRRFISSTHYTLPFMRDASPKSVAFRAYGADSIPTTVVIDKSGKVAAYFVGAQVGAVRKSVENELTARR